MSSKKQTPKNGGFPQTHQNGGFRMLLQVMKMSQSVQLPAAAVSSLCVTHVMQSQPGNGVSCFQWHWKHETSLQGCDCIMSLWMAAISRLFHYKHCVILSKFWVVYICVHVPTCVCLLVLCWPCVCYSYASCLCPLGRRAHESRASTKTTPTLSSSTTTSLARQICVTTQWTNYSP